MPSGDTKSDAAQFMQADPAEYAAGVPAVVEVRRQGPKAKLPGEIQQVGAVGSAADANDAVVAAALSLALDALDLRVQHPPALGAGGPLGLQHLVQVAVAADAVVVERHAGDVGVDDAAGAGGAPLRWRYTMCGG